MGIVSCCASPEEVERRMKLAGEIHSLQASRGLPFWIAIGAGVLLSVCLIHRLLKGRNPPGSMGSHLVSVFIYIVLFSVLIRASSIVLDIIADFSPDFVPMGQFRVIGFILSDPLGAVIISAAFFLTNPVLLHALLRGRGAVSLMASFVPLVLTFSGAIFYFFSLLFRVTAG